MTVFNIQKYEISDIGSRHTDKNFIDVGNLE